MLASHGARETLADWLPEPIRPLARLAFNYWWSWQLGGEELWRSIDATCWEASGHNPVRLLRDSSPATLSRAAADPAVRQRMERLLSGLDAELARPYAPAPSAGPEAPVAFVCAEYGVHVSLPVYSGGLGVLAGDLVKEASDRSIPLVAVGLLYRRGYFHQRLDPSGWQHEHWTVSNPEQLPLERVIAPGGAPLLVEVPLRGRNVRLAVWRADVGRVPLFLLDADVPDNGAVERFVTAVLYVGEPELRLMQYAVLGIGAIRALTAMGIRPAFYHLNEGHAALAALELVRECIASGHTFDDAVAAARERIVFTTHTPVAAGNETYRSVDVVRTLGSYLGEVGQEESVLALGRAPGAPPAGVFGMTDLAIRTSRSTNGVSRRHGEVARAMWAHHWSGRPARDVPISYVTNGVHLPTWMASPMRELLVRRLGPGWLEHTADPWRWAGIDDIPDEEIWDVRCRLRAALVELVRIRSVSDRLARGERLEYVERAARAFDPSVLTLGFARRVASYKRLHLIVADARRALALLAGSRPVQMVIAGKAHPKDDDAKRIVQIILALKDEPMAADRAVFLEDYDLALAQHVVSGCDVWVNLPRAPLEASGTSGMKAALNGALNLSVLDGWWCEGFDGTNGWAIHADPVPDGALQDARDADELYGLLEREIVPTFYERDDASVPHAWVRRIKASLRSIGPAFTSARMLNDYVVKAYRAHATDRTQEDD